MLTRRIPGTLCPAVAAAIFAATFGCEARPNALAARTAARAVCADCHGLPPSKDAHQVHVGFLARADPKADPADSCLQCHRDVQSVNQPDHLVDGAGVPLQPPAVVRFDDAVALAGDTQPGATRVAGPSYDRTARTCSNVYCHGAGLKSPSADIVTAPAWDAPAGSITCGKCHGIPPADHPANLSLASCTSCHGDAIDATGTPSPVKHVNGTVDLGASVTSSCAACHGDRSAGVLPGDPRSAPPTDAEGRPASDPSATSVGAHQDHVVAGTLGVAVACSECHLVPSTLLAPGHFDGQVTVTFGALASKGGLTPTYEPASQTCSNVYCHGNFPGSKVTLPPPVPTWRGGEAAVACGSCHDLPPPPPTHVIIGVPGCNGPDPSNPAVACHPSPYTPTPVDPTLHIDGRICPPSCTPAAP
jgi:predicted CxxxxCH...CXXCH cytochrome family protein